MSYKGLGRGGTARRQFAKYPSTYGLKTPESTYYRRQYNKRKRQIAKAQKQEYKFLDTSLILPMNVVAVCSTSGQTGNMHIIAQGDGDNDREGRQIVITSIQLRGTVTLVPAANPTATDVAFLAVILDTQANGSNPAITDVFTTNSMDDNMINLTNDFRFKIIKKFSWNLTSTAGVSGAYNNITKFHKWYKKCAYTITYNGANGTVAQTLQNNIFLAFGSTNTTGLINWQGKVRIRFTG